MPPSPEESRRAHVQQRARERLQEAAGFTDTSVGRLVAFTESVARNPKMQYPEGHAIHVMDLPERTNSSDSSGSNGEQVWGIAREGELSTMMLRRRSQPATTDALRVGKVTHLRTDDVFKTMRMRREGEPKPPPYDPRTGKYGDA